MKGVILAGGNGTRLYPATRCLNKHLLPIFDGKVHKPMLQHCVEKMVSAGIDDLLVVTGGEHIGAIAEFLGGGSEFNCHMTYRVQEKAGGIAQALGLADGFVREGESMCVLLGDNIFEGSMSPMVSIYSDFAAREDGRNRAMIVLKQVSHPERFGVAEMDRNGIRVKRIVEKPAKPKTRLAVTGIYFYPHSVFDVIRTLKPSGRGELEITDVNNHFISKGWMESYFLGGWWTDAGTHESYRTANLMPGERE